MSKFKITKLAESGYSEAMQGLALSYYDHAVPVEEFWTPEQQARTKRRATALAFRSGGHNKYLASIFTWWYIVAPRYWWSEYDTYKVATTAQSASTMHTLPKRLVSSEDFDSETNPLIISEFNVEIRRYWVEKDISRLKANLPEGWLQERQVCVNYMTLQNIILQRKTHRLRQWREFCTQVLEQVEHPELLEQELRETNHAL